MRILPCKHPGHQSTSWLTLCEMTDGNSKNKQINKNTTKTQKNKAQSGTTQMQAARKAKTWVSLRKDIHFLLIGTMIGWSKIPPRFLFKYFAPSIATVLGISSTSHYADCGETLYGKTNWKDFYPVDQSIAVGSRGHTEDGLLKTLVERSSCQLVTWYPQSSLGILQVWVPPNPNTPAHHPWISSRGVKLPWYALPQLKSLICRRLELFLIAYTAHTRHNKTARSPRSKAIAQAQSPTSNHYLYFGDSASNPQPSGFTLADGVLHTPQALLA